MGMRKGAAIAWSLSIATLAILSLGAIAGPKLLTFQARAPQSEARGNLARLLRAECDGFHGGSRAAFIPAEMAPERGNRFAYFAALEGPVQLRATARADRDARGYAAFANDTFKNGGQPLTSAASTPCLAHLGSGRDGALVLGAQDAGVVLLAARALDDGRVDCCSIASIARDVDGESVAAGSTTCATYRR